MLSPVLHAGEVFPKHGGMMMNNTSAAPVLDATYIPDGEAVQSFQDLGHVLLRGILNADELAAYRKLISDAVASRREAAKGGAYLKPIKERKTYDKAFMQMMNLWEEEEPLKAFSLSRRFGRIAADLLGVDAVRLYHDQALFKEPGGGFTPWHQDQYYWPLSTEKTVTMWMPLVDVGVEMGSLVFASRQHRDGPLANLQISDDSESVYRDIMARRGARLATNELKAGDATWHAGWTPHKAPGNSTDRMRNVMTVIFYADGCRVTELQNPNQRGDLERWLPGCKPGDPAVSPLNPIVYSRGSGSAQ